MLMLLLVVIYPVFDGLERTDVIETNILVLQLITVAISLVSNGCPEE